MNLKYERTENFEGKPSKAMEIARNTFLPHGFEIIQSDDSSLEIANKGFPWGNNPNPIKVISSISISFSDGEITLQAELGGVKKLILYTSLFILGMAVLFLVTFGIFFGLKQNQPMSKIALMSLAPLAPWPFIIPIMSIWFKNRAIHALDTLMNNMLTASQSSRSDRLTKRKTY